MELNGKKSFKNLIMTSKYDIDEYTKELIDSNTTIYPLLKLLKFFLYEDEWSFARPTINLKQYSYKVLARIFLEEMLKLRASCDND
jgi:hypothetical protein